MEVGLDRKNTYESDCMDRYSPPDVLELREVEKPIHVVKKRSHRMGPIS
jgi:hypothetical protein